MSTFAPLSSRRGLATRIEALDDRLAALGSVGNTFYVDSVTGSNSAGRGTRLSEPVATIDYAIGLCTANNGDKIIVLPSHAETISGAAGINMDVEGVEIIGVGHGANRPTITLSAVASTFAMNAQNCKISNLLFQVTEDTTIIVDVNLNDCTIENCVFRSAASPAKEFVTAIDITGSGANKGDRTKVLGCEFWSPAAGANQAIELGEVADQVEIRNCQAWGDYANACIHNPTGKVLTRLLIADCFLENTQTGDHSIELVSACTGMLVRNMYKNDMTQATGCDPGSCFSFQCFHDDAIDTNAILCPAAT